MDEENEKLVQQLSQCRVSLRVANEELQKLKTDSGQAPVTSKPSDEGSHRGVDGQGSPPSSQSDPI